MPPERGPEPPGLLHALQLKYSSLSRKYAELVGRIQREQPDSAGLPPERPPALALVRAKGLEVANASFRELWTGRGQWVSEESEYPSLSALLRACPGVPELTARTEGRLYRIWQEPQPGKRLLVVLEDVSLRSALVREIASIRDLHEKCEHLGVTVALTAAVGHDLAGTLRAIAMRLQTAQRVLPPDLALALREGTDAAMHAVRQLLDAARSEAIAFGPVNAATLVHDAIHIAQNDRPAAAPTIQYEVAGPATVPPVWGSSPEVLSILLTLFRNAADSMPRGGKVSVKLEPQSARLCVHVRDEGNGIPPAIASRLFEPFFTTKGSGGTGIGLWLARTSAVRMGGTLELRSSRRRGTLFVLELPCAGVRAPAFEPVRRRPAEAPAPTPSAPTARAAPALRKTRPARRNAGPSSRG